jgi:hypothetical protein
LVIDGFLRKDLEHSGKACRREHRPVQGDRHAIGKAKALADLDPFPRREAKRRGLAGIGISRLEAEHAFRRRLACGIQIPVKAHAPAQRVGGLHMRHEHARTAARVHQAGLGQIGQRAADRVAIDPEPVGQSGLRRKLVAAAVLAGGDLLAQRIADRGPEGGSSHHCHQIFTGPHLRLTARLHIQFV